MLGCVKLMLFLLINTFCEFVYTFDVNDYSNKLYREISKNFSIQQKSHIDKQFQLNPKYVKRVELVLREKYGEKEVNYFRQMLNDYYHKDKEDVKIFDDSLQIISMILINLMITRSVLHSGNFCNNSFYRSPPVFIETGDDLETARIIIRLIKREFEKFENVKNECIVPNLGRFSQIRSLARDLPVPTRTDTPCSTQASCDKLAMLMNLCSYIRSGVGFAYDIYATMIHVLGNMLSVLCGCIFVGPAHVCLLKNFPVSPLRCLVHRTVVQWPSPNPQKGFYLDISILIIQLFTPSLGT
ncbi:uncharacterized protein TA20855 [Theileria annulata]|uniref:Uncharacterized protein n=1 Tax=Theileria annulata TaxID=5874 RepID=Q4UGY4_THEAN|nr:uncharacterized protein TA20855 [Theileria annulata]CAI73655.1 hypothetical protein TA20855 [Theileria annulata]|eukprot:XP_954332.1 hypothetical protein TA20855 [Theileria annulata]